jgi:hypothetical protein
MQRLYKLIIKYKLTGRRLQRCMGRLSIPIASQMIVIPAIPVRVYAGMKISFPKQMHSPYS